MFKIIHTYNGSFFLQFFYYYYPLYFKAFLTSGSSYLEVCGITVQNHSLDCVDASHNTVQSGSITKVLLQVKNNQFDPLYFIALVLHLYLD